jgi:hypothetical protein
LSSLAISISTGYSFRILQGNLERKRSFALRIEMVFIRGNLLDGVIYKKAPHKN